jgi:hypothetical protein
MFEEWSRVMGGILRAARIDGFLGNLKTFYEETDPDGAAFRTLVALWWDKHDDAEVGVAELWKFVENGDVLLDLGKGSDRSQKIRLGKLLGRMRDRRFEQLRIVDAGTRQRAQRWRLMHEPEE